jgi:haloacetate dehalogenase
MIVADPDAFYLRGIHATCEDYRAGATLDVDHDEADRGSRCIGCPTLVLWGSRGSVARVGDVLAEEAPDATCDELPGFFEEVTA